MKRLQGKKAIVVGGRTGIGEKITAALAEEGVSVGICSRNVEGGHNYVNELRRKGFTAVFEYVDMQKAESIREGIKNLVDNLDGIDYLVNCAGINIRKSFLDYEEEEWDGIIDTNLKGPFIACQTVAPYMIKQRQGCIVNISSIRDAILIPNMAPYSVSKAGLTQLTRTLALELAKYGVTVNAVAPSYTRTPLMGYVLEKAGGEQNLASRIPAGRIAETADVYAALLFFLLPEANYITGQIIHVDGGLSFTETTAGL
jgi:NAD(P)-dependent dehydrogenase (short-subunit alcohol dehydrogenase family)